MGLTPQTFLGCNLKRRHEMQEQIIDEYLKILELAVLEADFKSIQLFYSRACQLVEENGRIDFWDRIDEVYSSFQAQIVWEGIA
jgi:hypothetical protein